MKNVIEKTKHVIGQVLLLFLPFKVFDLYLGMQKGYSYEDPKCPLSWRGSGCYDIQVYGWDYTRFRICARTEQEAERLFDEWREARYKMLLKEYSEGAETEWQKRRARDRAEEYSFHEGIVLGFQEGNPAEGALEKTEIEEVGSVEGKWSQEDTFAELEDALLAFD